MKQQIRTRSLVFAALFVAVTAACSQILLPIGPVPISMGTFAVLLTGAVLGPTRGAAAIAVYVLLGSFGAPVFSAFRGGVGMLVGPTGGFIVGYIPMAFLAGLSASGGGLRAAFSMLVGNLVLYAIGAAWFMVYSGQELLSVLMVCVVPFIPGDILKIAAAIFVSEKLRPLGFQHIPEK